MNIQPIRNDFQRVRKTPYDGGFRFTDYEIVARACRTYKCNKCGETSPVVANAAELQAWSSKHESCK